MTSQNPPSITSEFLRYKLVKQNIVKQRDITLTPLSIYIMTYIIDTAVDETAKFIC